MADCEVEIVYDLSKEFDVLKDVCGFQHNVQVDSSNMVYLALGAKIYVLSIRRIALSKCVLQDVIDSRKL